MQNIPKKITIGIPAYNEEANIKHLLVSLLAQKTAGLELKEIIVISDGSSDNTVKECRSVGDARILVFEDGQRKGQAKRHNEILDKSSGDIVVMLNADVLPKDEFFLEHIILPICGNDKIGIVGAKVMPMKAKTFFEKIINFSVEIKSSMIEAWNGGNNIYACHGRARAFSHGFAEKFRLPEVVSEDAYSYLACKQMGFEFAYEPRAEVVYRSPQHLRDHMRQSARFFQGKVNLANFFSATQIQKEHAIPRGLYLKTLLKYFFKSPILFCGYVGVLTTVSVSRIFTNQAMLQWRIADSSKNLISKKE